jgi:hypothetical protein
MILPSIIIVLFLIVLLIDKNCIHMYSRKLLWPLNIYLIFNITDTWTFISLDVLILLFTFLFRPVCSFEFNSQIENIVQPYSENWKMLFLCLLGHFLEDHNQMATFSVKVRLQLGTCMHQTVSTHLKISICNLFYSLLQTLLHVEVLFVIAGMLNSHFAWCKPCVKVTPVVTTNLYMWKFYLSLQVNNVYV